MAGPKLLLDTNIFIPLEDPRIVPPAIAELAQKAHRYGIELYLDEACIEDIRRDPDLERREATLSKLRKFPVLDSIAHRKLADQESRFGPIRDDNDRCDVLMLDTLDLGIVDFLITEDLGVHRRAAFAGLRRRVFTLEETASWIQRTYEPRDFRLRHIEARKAYQISIDEPLFASVREDYKPKFDEWWAKCQAAHRDCWIVNIDGNLAGLVVRKDETHAEALTVHPGPRILKICTLKMKVEYQGEKFGEQLLKKIFWFAQGNAYDLIYVTVFPKHELLITLLRTFGFETTQVRSNGELVMERPLHLAESVALAEGDSHLKFALRRYPRYCDGPSVAKYVIPIQSEFHTILFPEIAEVGDLPLFPQERFLLSTSRARDKTPGNTIRKVYICRSPTRTLLAGDIVLFYLGRSEKLTRSQSVTTVGIIEHVELAKNIGDLVRRVGRRSVYARQDLEAMKPSPTAPVLVIDFLLMGHFNPALALTTLLQSGIFVRRPPQSIKRLDDDSYSTLMQATRVSFE